ncbi:hypothetical protein B0H13DRAFT_2350528 [Mycena leptocephala]|nr:hypothetical protein B0H13DRAFT_2350528 [Mycena leptocephala]
MRTPRTITLSAPSPRIVWSTRPPGTITIPTGSMNIAPRAPHSTRHGRLGGHSESSPSMCICGSFAGPARRASSSTASPRRASSTPRMQLASQSKYTLGQRHRVPADAGLATLGSSLTVHALRKLHDQAHAFTRAGRRPLDAPRVQLVAQHARRSILPRKVVPTLAPRPPPSAP